MATELSSAVRTGRVAALLLGVSLALVWISAPERSAPWAVFAALAPFLLALRSAWARGSRRRGAVLGLVFGAGLWGAWCPYMVHGFQHWYHVEQWVAALMFVVFCLFNAVPYGLFGALSAALQRGRRLGAVRDSLALASLVGIYPAFVPANPAVTLYAYPEMVQSVALGGISLLYFLVILVNALLVRAWERVFDGASAERRAAVLPLAAALAVVAFMAVGGQWRMTRVAEFMHEQEARSSALSVLAVQPNLPEAPLFLFSKAGARHLDDVWRMVEEATDAHPDARLVIWPEAPTSMTCDCEDVQDVPVVLAGLSFLFGCTDVQEDERGVEVAHYNAARLVDANSCPRSYHKRRLVPFSETVPFDTVLGWVREVLPDVGESQAGTESELLRFGSSVGIGPLICYESFFPDLARESVEAGANVLLNQVSDGWFGGGRPDGMHLGMSALRAVEFGVPLVRVGNAGGCGLVLPTGEVVAGTRTQPMTMATREMRVVPMRMPTTYARLGEWFLWLAVAVLVAELVALARTSSFGRV